MIKTFIFVEDGSVDFDALQRTVGDETKVIVYRQGASSPEIKQPEFPISQCERINSGIRKYAAHCQG